MILKYDSEYDFRAEKWVKTELDKLSVYTKQQILEFQSKLFQRIYILREKAEIIEEDKLESVLGELYFNLYILLHIMLKFKYYSNIKPFDKNLDDFFKTIDRICFLFDEHSSSLRSEQIIKLAKKL